MLSITRHELDALTIGTAACLIAVVFVSACCAWQQEKEIRRQRDVLDQQDEDIDKLWAWCIAAAEALGWHGDDGPGGDDPDSPPPDPPDPGPLELEPDTVISHPADTYARKAALLARYTHLGQHRT